PLIPVLGAALGVVVLALLLVILLRGGSKRPATGGTPAPVVAAGRVGPGMPGPVAGPPIAPAPMPMPQPNPEFMYGPPGAPQGMPGAMPQPGMPPGLGASPAVVQRAILQSQAGVFTITPGLEMHVGRDGARCEILLSEARVSGLHASLKLENNQLMVRDENSNNGTLVNGARLQPGAWTSVPNGSLVRFGPVEMSLRLE
ncbi:MAG: FHA domain-containing protein, partial [Myxococcales bacterium]